MVHLGDETQWMLVSVCLEIVLILMQDRCTVCAQSTPGLEIILDTHDVTPRQCGLCGILFWSVIGDSVSVGARYVHGLCQTYHRDMNRFGRIRWYS
jgi:hypothetical protein